MPGAESRSEAFVERVRGEETDQLFQELGCEREKGRAVTDEGFGFP